MKPGKLLLIAHSDKHLYSNKCRDENGFINDNYIIEFAPDRKEEATIR